MPTIQKAETIKTITEKFQTAPAVYLLEYQGINVEKITALRKNFREIGSELKIVKNTLTKIAADSVGYKDLGEYLTGPTALVFCGNEVVAPAKILVDFARENQSVSIKGGIVEGQVIKGDGVKKMASVPSRQVLLGQFVYVLISPVAGFVRTLNGVPQNFVRVLDAIAKKKEEESK